MAIITTDIWVMAASSALLVIFVVTGWRLSRWEGGFFVTAYAAYIAWLIRFAAAGA